jgi:hypothetical protein
MHVLVEGRDDREFFIAVVKPRLEQAYDHVEVWEYARATIDRRRKYIKSVKAMNADYLFVADINSSPCITERKEGLVSSHGGMIDADRMVIVVREIESWYVAGMEDRTCQELGITDLLHAETVTKEELRAVMPKRFGGSAVDFMAEMLREFRVERARNRSRSFCYMMDLLEGSIGA